MSYAVMFGFALWHARQIDLDAEPAARRHLRARARQPRRAHILDRDHRAGAHRLEARLQQQLLHERVAHLHVGPLLLRFLAEFRRRQQRRAVNPVAPRFRADVNHRIAHAARLREEKLLASRDPQRQRIHQRIIRIARLENHFAANRRDAKAVAVKSDPANHAVENPPVPRNLFAGSVSRGRSRVDRPESQRIEHRNRPRAHRENIAQDSADARRRALKRLDEARMVVRFDLEHRHEPVADVDHARIFARPLHHVRPARRQLLQVNARRFVRAVLAPHHAENAKLGEVRIAPENLLDACVFVGGEAVLGRDLRRNFNFGFDHLLVWDSG